MFFRKFSIKPSKKSVMTLESQIASKPILFEKNKLFRPIFDRGILSSKTGRTAALPMLSVILGK